MPKPLEQVKEKATRKRWFDFNYEQWGDFQEIIVKLYIFVVSAVVISALLSLIWE